MSILLDFIPFQILGGVGGAASFTKAVYDEFFRRKPAEVRVLAAYDATLPVEGRYNCHKIAEAWGITLIDISTQTLVEVIRREAVNTFFIAIGQFYSRFDLKGIDCKTIMFIHDIFDVERCDNRIDLILSDKQHESGVETGEKMDQPFVGTVGQTERRDLPAHHASVHGRKDHSLYRFCILQVCIRVFFSTMQEQGTHLLFSA